MKLWLISQSENSGYDTYDSAVVAAETQADAVKIHPGEHEWGNDFGTWALNPAGVVAKEIGTAVKGTKAGVICASFNAG